MNKDILKKELDKLGVNPNEYSLNGNIESDKIVLYQNYSKWEVFYFDERGGRNCEKVFCNEEDACSYIYELFNFKKNYEIRYIIAFFLFFKFNFTQKTTTKVSYF